MKIEVVKVSCVRESSEIRLPEELSTPECVARCVRELTHGEDREHVYLFCLDGKNRIRSASLISIGTLTASLVAPREVFRPAVVTGAAAIIVAHTHPSGGADLSAEDKNVAHRLKVCGDLLGIPLLDFISVGESSHMSAEHGYGGTEPIWIAKNPGGVRAVSGENI